MQMFRKPKVKGATRRRTDGWDDNQDAEGTTTESIQKKVIASVKLCDDEDVDTLVSKPPALLSFDNDEGADADFVIKKNKKKVKELKRLQKLEEEAANETVKEEEDLQKENEKEKYKKKKDRDKDREKDRKESKTRYLDKYRDCSSKVKPPQPDSDEEAEHDSHARFPGTFASIPDSRAVYEAKKRRERMRREGVDGIIPLDDDQKLVDKGARARLIREDENDDSDEEAPKFYSSKDLLRNEEERRREEQGHFLEQEQGDERDADEEADEWEKQQILKAVSRHTIGQIRADYDNSTRLYRQRLQESAVPEAMDMDIDMDDIVENFRTKNIGDVVDREERLNTRRYEVKKIEDTLEENKATIVKMEGDIPVLANKYAMYQELRAYCRSLLDCLNEKVSEINELGDKRQALAKARVERLARRRRRDMRDAYSDCVTAAAGKNPSTTRTPDAMIRSKHIIFPMVSAEIDVALRMVFVDALDDYAHLRKVLDRMIDWFAVDSTTFQNAYISLCIPKLASPYVRIQLITADILNHEVIKGIIPLIIEKVVLPYLTDVVNVEWEPMSLKQSKRLGAVLSGLSEYPKLNLEDSKSFAALAVAVKAKITAAIDDDLFVPIYSKHPMEYFVQFRSIKNPATGCSAFLDRQYWAAIKLIRGLKAFSSFLNPASRLELVLDGVVNRVCVVALETGILDDLSCERKVRALLAEIPEEMIETAKPDSFRNLIRCLGKVLEEQKNAGRSYYREVRKYMEKLQKKADE
ncbi:unnamed protein product [Angiostrongylus costaricensis]|uniref:GCFC domain-containing protein n=1 Tax=Angiostrongylus costaricensis TaxID=334426 RepID=A0A0R3PLK3_ANGCS|nr:unnamed protein product [Angiostrongylus costaricensis]